MSPVNCFVISSHRHSTGHATESTDAEMRTLSPAFTFDVGNEVNMTSGGSAGDTVMMQVVLEVRKLFLVTLVGTPAARVPLINTGECVSNKPLIIFTCKTTPLYDFPVDASVIPAG